VTAADLAIISALVFAWGCLSARLERFDVTGPIVFTAAGLLLTHGPLRALGITPSAALVKLLAELTLALVLFSDASRVGLHQLRADLGLCLRLLTIGLPLTIGLGTLLALTLPGVTDIWVALLIGAALAPTDAALGAGMMLNPATPARIRRLINVESGLNDGIATPVVLVAVAGAATAEHTGHVGPGAAAVELVVGLFAGAALGAGGGWLIKIGRRRDWVADGFAGAAVLGLAVCSYAASVALHGNGFIAAFTAGLGFAAAAGPAARYVPFVEETGTLVSLLVWLLFGAIAVVPAFEELSWQAVVYAALSLTVIRMVPVALALTGSHLGHATAAFVGWFGPRGLASVVFGLLALETLGEAAARPATTVIAFTVLLSVVAHGLTADPLANRFGPRLKTGMDADTAQPAPVPVRRLIRRRPHPAGPAS
jgi:NhaP-type Na+/H+ or K+/H+ antiporter